MAGNVNEEGLMRTARRRSETIAGWSAPIGLVLSVLLGACASSTGTPQQVRIAVTEQAGAQRLAFACAESCEVSQPPGSGALFDCVRRCPGVDVSEDDACALSATTSHAICYGNQPGSGTIGPHDRDNAARLAIGLLRGLSDARTSVASLRMRSTSR